MAEWFKAAVLETAVGASLPWVRIPSCPPPVLYKSIGYWMDFRLAITDALIAGIGHLRNQDQRNRAASVTFRR